MTSTRVPWSAGTWHNAPQATREVGHHLVVEAVEGSDFWEKTLYGFQHDSGHALLAPWDDDAAIEVSFDLRGFTELYDQAGLMLWHGPRHWIKAGVELNDGVPHLGAVVTNEFSDWSLAPVPDWMDSTVTVRASYAKGAVILRASANGGAWRMLRVAPFPYAAGRHAGPFVCAPQRAGLNVTFTRWSRTAPDADLHVDPPLPELG
jgi:regulation of enolase protein 1 (concanavalin A-like superfamily)